MSAHREHYDFITPLSAISGISVLHVQAFGRCGIRTVEDLLFIYPQYYYRTTGVFSPNKAAIPVELCHISGQVISRKAVVADSACFCVVIETESHEKYTVYWQNYAPVCAVSVGDAVCVIGVRDSHDKHTIFYPDFVCDLREIVPYYFLNDILRDHGIDQGVMRRIIRKVFTRIRFFRQSLPQHIAQKYTQIDLESALEICHFPQEGADFFAAHRRIIVDYYFRYIVAQYWYCREFSPLPRVVYRADLSSRLQDDPVLEQIAELFSHDTRKHILLHGDGFERKRACAHILAQETKNVGGSVLWICEDTRAIRRISRRFLESGDECLLFLVEDSPKILREKCALLRENPLVSCVTEIENISLIVSQISPSLILFDSPKDFSVYRRLHLLEKCRNADHVSLLDVPFPEEVCALFLRDTRAILCADVIESSVDNHDSFRLRSISDEQIPSFLLFLKTTLGEQGTVLWFCSPKRNCFFDSSDMSYYHSRVSLFREKDISYTEEHCEFGAITLYASSIRAEEFPCEAVVIIDSPGDFDAHSISQILYQARVCRASWIFVLGDAHLSYVQPFAENFHAAVMADVANENPLKPLFPDLPHAPYNEAELLRDLFRDTAILLGTDACSGK